VQSLLGMDGQSDSAEGNRPAAESDKLALAIIVIIKKHSRIYIFYLRKDRESTISPVSSKGEESKDGEKCCLYRYFQKKRSR